MQWLGLGRKNPDGFCRNAIIAEPLANIRKKMKNYLIIFILFITTNTYSQIISKTIYYDNGNIKFKGKIDTINNIKIGTWEEFYPNGKIKSISNCNNKRPNSFSRRNLNDLDRVKELQEFECIRTGEWKDFHENGEVSWSRSYLNGVEIGLDIKKYSNGNIKIIGENSNSFITVLDLPRTGEWKGYFEDGTLQWIGQYNKGLKSGKWFEYFENGNIKTNLTYEKNKREGLFKLYYENGKLKSIGIIKSNVVVGEYEEYFDNGQLNIKIYFENDGRLNTILEYYDKNGNSLDKGTIKNGNGSFKKYDSDNNLVKTVYYENGIEKKK